jgi:hypothetical protein
MTGTLINIVTVLLGGGAGTLIGHRLPDRMRETVMHGLGLVTFLVGLQMALQTNNILIVMGSILAGGLLGEWWEIERRLDDLGQWIEARISQAGDTGTSGPSVGQAFVTASLVFCVGPMSILGSIQDGLTGDFRLLAIKSMLDGFAAMAFSTTMGWGVMLAAITILLYQGGLSLLAGLVGAGVASGLTSTRPEIVELTATGGVLIMGIGLLLLEIKRIRVANFLPAIAIAPLIVMILARFS